MITVIYQKVSRDDATLTYKNIFVCQAVEIGRYISDFQASIADTARPISTVEKKNERKTQPHPDHFLMTKIC